MYRAYQLSYNAHTCVCLETADSPASAHGTDHRPFGDEDPWRDWTWGDCLASPTLADTKHSA